MKGPNRKIILFVAGFVLGLVLYLANRLVLKPLAKIDQDTKSVLIETTKLRQENRTRPATLLKIRQVTERTFGPAADETSVRGDVEAHLAELLRRSDLQWDRINSVAGRSQRGVYQEVTRDINAVGRLDQIVNFLYLLEQQPFLYRIRGLVIKPVINTDRVELSLEYSTPLPEPIRYPSKVKTTPPPLATGRFEPGKTAGVLTSDDRKLYTALAQRDPFRRYIPRPKVVARPPQNPPSQRARPPVRPPDPPPQPPSDSRYRLTSLTKINGVPQIRIEDLRAKTDAVYAIGDAFEGSLLAHVDYRELPSAENPRITCPRLILRKGPDYWVVERGQTFDKKRLLKPEELPEALQASVEPEPEPDSKPAPAADAGSPTPGEGQAASPQG